MFRVSDRLSHVGSWGIFLRLHSWTVGEVQRDCASLRRIHVSPGSEREVRAQRQVQGVVELEMEAGVVLAAPLQRAQVPALLARQEHGHGGGQHHPQHVRLVAVPARSSPRRAGPSASRLLFLPLPGVPRADRLPERALLHSLPAALAAGLAHERVSGPSGPASGFAAQVPRGGVQQRALVPSQKRLLPQRGTCGGPGCGGGHGSAEAALVSGGGALPGGGDVALARPRALLRRGLGLGRLMHVSAASRGAAATDGLQPYKARPAPCKSDGRGVEGHQSQALQDNQRHGLVRAAPRRAPCTVRLLRHQRAPGSGLLALVLARRARHVEPGHAARDDRTDREVDAIPHGTASKVGPRGRARGTAKVRV
mmetsp:Transcript_27312/g.51993  ORF Transcript_27312/g.51993 Transcript_27312/m.51993 type:complete len:367 (+) Transcript_27312:312-1412(+)